MRCPPVRRPSRLVLLLPLLALLLGILAAPAAAHAPDTDAAAGPTARTQLTGLDDAARGPCAGGYRITGTDLCTHGPDARPAGRRITVQPRSIAATIESPLPDAVLCDGDGRSGRRVQAIYARVAGTPSRRSTVIPLIRTAAAGVQSAFLASAARTDGVRRPRWVTDETCRLKVIEVELSDKARKSLGATITELQQRGHGRADRKYLVWFDSDVYCGIATFWGDDRPTADNLSDTRTGYARVDTACWGWAESHELMHLLGAVQNSAPHTTYGVAPGAFGHCTDDYDVMCYPDAVGVTMTVVCPDRGLDAQFDCGDDDYFHTDPPAGSYLAGHWNSADSRWLERRVVELRTPVPALAVGAWVGDGRVPVVTTLASRAPLAGVESIEVQRRRDAGAWSPVRLGADGVTLVSALRAGSETRLRVRMLDGAGDPAAWRVGPDVTGRIRDDGHRTLRWSGAWRSVHDVAALGGEVRRTRKAGATVTVTTEADQVGLITTRGPLAGRIGVRVDGVGRGVIDLTSEEVVTRTLATIITLGPGRHTLELTVRAPRAATAGWHVELDGIALLHR